MPRSITRRSVLLGVGGGVVGGLAGCIRAGGPDDETTVNPDPGPDPSPDGETTAASGNATTTEPKTRTYGIEVRNELTVAEFEATDELSDPQPAVVDVRVTNLDPNDDTTYFEETVEVATGESETFPEAFTVTFDRTTYAMSAELEPFVEGGLSRDDNRKAGHTFTPGGDNMPTNDPIAITVLSFDREDAEGMFPVVGINAGE